MWKPSADFSLSACAIGREYHDRPAGADHAFHGCPHDAGLDGGSADHLHLCLCVFPPGETPLLAADELRVT